MPGYRFRCVSLGSVRIFLFRLGNPTDDFRVQRGLSGDHLTHQLLVDFDTGMFRKDWVQGLSVSFNESMVQRF